MKRLLPYILLTLLLAACTTRGRYNAMRAGLDSINQLNRTDQPFAADDVMPYTDYFDRHGTANDRLLAHYLLGRAYHVHGEAPMALQCYQEAADCADTTATDCDYAQLCRVYGQMGDIFYDQELYDEQLKQMDLAAKYAWLGKDTLAALASIEQKCTAYRNIGLSDSAINLAESIAKQYIHHGYHNRAAMILGSAVRMLINKGKYDTAKRYVNIYEKESGFFDNRGNILSGKEIYYHVKGLLYMKQNCLDSAEYWFRKELRDGKDFNNQNGGALGLAMLYEELHRPDSAAKYYQYAYAMNDSMYAQQATEVVERMQSMYDYSRHQEQARKESERAAREKEKRQTVVVLLILVTLLSGATIYVLYQKKQAERAKYLQSIADLEQAQSDIMQLRQHDSDYATLIAQKEKQIEQLKKKMKKYSKLIYFDSADVERHLKSSTTYQDLEKKAIRGETPTDEDWRKIRMLVIEYLPGFNDFLTANAHRLTESKYNICILLRLHFKSVDISKILGIKPPSVSDACSSIMKNIFQKEGSAKELTATLSKIF